MGRQLQFYLTPSDLAVLEVALRASQEVAALPWRAPRPEPTVVESFRIERMGKTPLTLYLARPADLGAVAFREVAAQGYWTVDDLRSPVVELARCHFDGKTLRRGRLYYATGYYGGDGAWVDKPKAFLAWADALLRTARKALWREPRLDAYLGPEARELHDRNAAELVSM
jgi:hypothetical protein